MKFLFVLEQLGATLVRAEVFNGAALAAILFTTLIQNLRLSSSAEVLNCS